MPHIVSPIRSNLLLQMLLEGNVYIAVTWAVSYIFNMLIFEWRQLGLSVLLVFALATIVETLRLYVGYSLNLGPNGPRPKWLLMSTLILCLPLLVALWYLRQFLPQRNETSWLQLAGQLWLLLIALELAVAVALVWAKRADRQSLPDWSTIEANLQAPRRRPASKFY